MHEVQVAHSMEASTELFQYPLPAKAGPHSKLGAIQSMALTVDDIRPSQQCKS